jgi:hypothetical protein
MMSKELAAVNFGKRYKIASFKQKTYMPSEYVYIVRHVNILQTKQKSSQNWYHEARSLCAHKNKQQQQNNELH